MTFLSLIEKVKDKKIREIPDILIGNKIDLMTDREVTTEEAFRFAAEHGIPYIETSCRLRWNVDEAFALIVEEWEKKKLKQ